MANLFVTLPTPAAANGSGAAVDVSGMGPTKTITVTAAAAVHQPITTIEISNDAAGTNWAPLFSVQGATENRVVDVAARWMRATVSGYKDGANPQVGVGASGVAGGFATLVAPAGSGDGAAVDTSALPGFVTLVVTGAFRGVLLIEASEDAGATWATIASFVGPGQLSVIASGNRMRASRGGVPAVGGGQPVIDLAATNPPGGGGGASGTDQVFQYVATGAEGDAFNIALPEQRASNNYVAQVTGGGLAAKLLFDAPAASYTTLQFQCTCSAPPTAGDVLNVVVKDRTS